MNRKLALALLVIAMMGAFLIVGCDGGGGGKGENTSETGDSSGDTGGNGGNNDTAVTELTDQKVYVNPDDTMLYSYTSDKGELFTYYGRRDKSGMPTVITMVEYGDTAGDLYLIYYDRTGLPAKVIAGDGTTLEFDYHLMEVEGVEIGLTAALPIARAMAVKEIDVTLTVPKDDGPAVTSAIVALDEEVLVAPDPMIAEILGKDLYGNIEIIIDKCGQLVRPDGEVWVLYRPQTYQGRTSLYPAIPMSAPGHYISRIPQASDNEITPENVEAMCKSFAEALGNACSVFDPKVVGPMQAELMMNPAAQTAICGAVAAEMSLVATPATGAVAGGACAALLAGGTVACNTIGKSPPGFNQPNYMDTLLCSRLDDVVEGFNSATGVKKAAVQAVADFSNSRMPSMSVPGDDRSIYTSPVQEMSTYEPYPDLYISASDPTIDDISTVPGAPNTGEDYTVTADMSCVSGLDLSITVTRDGAPLSYESRFGNTSEKRIAIGVPGNPPGSVDAIAVSVRDPLTNDLLVQKRMTVELGEDPGVPVGGEAFVASVDIPGENISFNPINRSALITQWITAQDAVGLVASEGNNEDSEFISITINPNVVNGPGTYTLSSGEGTAALILFATPEVTHANVAPYGGTNVYFNQTGGTFTITQWGTYIGDTVSGRFSARITGTRITGEDQNGYITTQEYTGEITGSFNLEIIRTSY